MGTIVYQKALLLLVGIMLLYYIVNFSLITLSRSSHCCFFDGLAL